MHQNVSRDLLNVAVLFFWFFFVFIAQLCCGSASRTHLTYVSDALDCLSRNVTFTTPERICDFRGWRDNTMTPDQGHSGWRLSALGRFPAVWLRSQLQKKQNPICGKICSKLGPIISFKAECDSLRIKQLLRWNGRAAFKSSCLFPEWNESFFPNRKSQDHCHWQISRQTITRSDLLIWCSRRQ